MVSQLKKKSESDENDPNASPAFGDTSLADDKVSQLEGLRQAGEFGLVEAVSSLLIGKHPDAAVLYNFLGLAQQSLGKLDEAISNFRQGIRIDAGFADLHFNLAKALMAAGHANDAAESYLEALRLDPDSIEYVQSAAIDFFKLRNLTVTEAVISLLIHCLRSNDVEVYLLKKICETIILAASRQKMVVGANVVEVYSEIDHSIHGLLVVYLEQCTLSNPFHERFLTAVRAEFLNAYAQREGDGRFAEYDVRLLAALAFQCFWNEHIWFESETETARIDQLRADLLEAIKDGGSPDERMVYLLASYRPLHSLEPIRKWALDNYSQISGPLRNLLKLLICDPERERELKEGLRRLTTVDDKISLEVQSQYEENPYPRWTKEPVVHAMSYTDHILRHVAPHTPLLKPSTNTPRILIAGCGTGQHPIRTALSCINSSVLAVDLSSASLAYAMRRAEEMGVKNLEFGQADILKLEELGEKFDIIEAAGVIHHMANPLVGLKKLLGQLKPDGFLRLGLYSELARQEIAQLKQELDGQSVDLSAKGIRDFRHALQVNDPALHAKLSGRGDYYTTSNVRDLVFHVQEHRFTIPQLKEILDDHKLVFLGFIVRDHLVKPDYQAAFPDDPSCTNLDNWHLYEQKNPSIFSNMYQFWCRRADPK